jgi:carbon-monoxide dehydrogenase medium subunit
MFSPEFDYHKATSVAEATQLLNTNPGARVLAGGHSLIPLLKLRQARPSALIDIGGIAELKGISVDDGTIRIGALTTHRAIETSQELLSACPMLAEVAGGIGDSQVRNRGTLGGNAAHADPASDWPTVLTALNARFVVQGPGGTRTVAPADFFAGPLTTTLAEDEILTAIEIPRFGPNQRGEYAKMAHPASFFAVVGAAAVITIDGDRCGAASIAVGGLVPAPLRASSVERALVGQQLTAENIAAAAEQVASDLGENVTGDNVYASAEYRRAMAAVETRHALNHAAGLAHH